MFIPNMSKRLERWIVSIHLVTLVGALVFGVYSIFDRGALEPFQIFLIFFLLVFWQVGMVFIVWINEQKKRGR